MLFNNRTFTAHSTGRRYKKENLSSDRNEKYSGSGNMTGFVRSHRLSRLPVRISALLPALTLLLYVFPVLSLADDATADTKSTVAGAVQELVPDTAQDPSSDSAANTARGITIVETPKPQANVWIVEEDWSEEWSYDSTSHWHASKIPQVTEVSEKAEHTLTWTETRAATRQEDGEKTGVCSVCGYTETQPVVYVRPTRTALNLPSPIKWLIGIVIALVILALDIFIIHKITVTARKKRRERMAGRNKFYKR